MKVAICYSGETRSFNTTGKYALHRLKSELQKFGHTIDCYGVRWEDCDYPDQDIVEFVEVKTLSQNVLRDWVEADINSRAIINHAYALPRWEELYNLDINLIPQDELVYSTYSAIGQVIGGWMALQLPPREYDLYIRWRWDSYIALPQNNTFDHYSKKEGKDLMLQHFIVLFISYLECLASANCLFPPSITALAASGGDVRYKHATIDDVLMAFKPVIKNNIDKVDVFEYFANYLKRFPNLRDRLDAHSLWTDPLMSDMGAHFGFHPAPIFGIERSDLNLENFENRYRSYWKKYEQTYRKPLQDKTFRDDWH